MGHVEVTVGTWSPRRRRSHDDDDRRLHAAEQFNNRIFFTLGPDAEARRHRILALMEQEPETNLDLGRLGPESRCSDQLAARLLAL